MARWRRKAGQAEVDDQRIPSRAPDRAEFLRQFAGLWIAVWRDRVVAAGQTADEVFRQIDEKRLPDAVISRVPDPRKGIAVGLG